ncbi:MAG: hypothetical protein JJE28_01125 [Actinomycetales bacterium]|nr:hypothetical protein [Actinomycetales bacterium]
MAPSARRWFVTRSAISASTIDLDDLSARVNELSRQCSMRALSLEGAAQLVPAEWHFRAHAIAVQASQISQDLQGVSAGLRSISQAYFQREALLTAAGHEASSTLFWAMGRFLALLAPVAIPGAVGAMAAIMAAWTATGKRPEELISSPIFVAGLEYVVSGVDDFAAGLLGIPLPVMAVIGERGLGLSGPSAAASTILLGIGALGAHGRLSTIGSRMAEAPPATSTVLAETPVTVARASTESGRPPGGIEDLLGRIPRANPEMPQVRIERYEPVGGENSTFIVYLGGTIDSALLATDEPWDMTSNLAALAGLDAGSYRAATEAMHAAGIASDDLVTLVGHSQGGLLAARIAQSQEFRVGDVVTVGAPIHQVTIPHGVTLTAIEHNEDLVPTLGGLAVGGVALSGVARAATETMASGTTTTVRRSALTGLMPSTNDPVPGHNLSRYVETGRVIDNSADTQLTSLRARLATHAQGEAEITFWRGERVGR